MLNSRSFRIVWISKDKPVPFDPEAAPHAAVTYNGREIVVVKR